MGRRECFTGDQALGPVAHARMKQPGTERYIRDLNLPLTLLLTLSSIVSFCVELEPRLGPQRTLWASAYLEMQYADRGKLPEVCMRRRIHASQEFENYWYMSLIECNSPSKEERLCHAVESLLERWMLDKTTRITNDCLATIHQRCQLCDAIISSALPSSAVWCTNLHEHEP